MLDTLRGTQKQSHESTGGNSRESGAVAALRRAGRVLKADGGLEVGGSAHAARGLAPRGAAAECERGLGGGLSRVGCHLVAVVLLASMSSIEALDNGVSSSSPSNSSQVCVSRGLRGSVAGIEL